MDGMARVKAAMEPVARAGRLDDAVRVLLAEQPILELVAKRRGLDPSAEGIGPKLGSACCSLTMGHLREVVVDLFCHGMRAALDAISAGLGLRGIGYEAARRLGGQAAAHRAEDSPRPGRT